MLFVVLLLVRPVIFFIISINELLLKWFVRWRWTKPNLQYQVNWKRKNIAWNRGDKITTEIKHRRWWNTASVFTRESRESGSPLDVRRWCSRCSRTSRTVPVLILNGYTVTQKSLCSPHDRSPQFALHWVCPSVHCWLVTQATHRVQIWRLTAFCWKLLSLVACRIARSRPKVSIFDQHRMIPSSRNRPTSRTDVISILQGYPVSWPQSRTHILLLLHWILVILWYYTK